MSNLHDVDYLKSSPLEPMDVVVSPITSFTVQILGIQVGSLCSYEGMVGGTKWSFTRFGYDEHNREPHYASGFDTKRDALDALLESWRSYEPA